MDCNGRWRRFKSSLVLLFILLQMLEDILCYREPWAFFFFLNPIFHCKQSSAALVAALDISCKMQGYWVRQCVKINCIFVTVGLLNSAGRTAFILCNFYIAVTGGSGKLHIFMSWREHQADFVLSNLKLAYVSWCYVDASQSKGCLVCAVMHSLDMALFVCLIQYV